MGRFRGRDADETVEVDLLVSGIADKVFFVKKDDDGEEFTLPKSQVEVDRPARGKVSRFTVPGWLARDRGLD